MLKLEMPGRTASGFRACAMLAAVAVASVLLALASTSAVHGQSAARSGTPMPVTPSVAIVTPSGPTAPATVTSPTGTPTPQPAPPNSLSGVVVDSKTNAAVAGAIVRISGQRAITAANGSFSIDLAPVLPSIPVGADGLQRLTVTVEAAGYGLWTAENVYFGPGETSKRN